MQDQLSYHYLEITALKIEQIRNKTGAITIQLKTEVEDIEIFYRRRKEINSQIRNQLQGEEALQEEEIQAEEQIHQESILEEVEEEEEEEEAA